MLLATMYYILMTATMPQNCSLYTMMCLEKYINTIISQHLKLMNTQSQTNGLEVLDDSKWAGLVIVTSVVFTSSM